MSVELKIKVTKEIINKTRFCGLKGEESVDNYSSNCAIALAVRDIFPIAYVGPCFITVCTHDNSFMIDLPVEATEFIHEFDDATGAKSLVECIQWRQSLDPIEFSIQVPDELIEKINIDEISKVLENHPNLELV